MGIRRPGEEDVGQEKTNLRERESDVVVCEREDSVLFRETSTPTTTGEVRPGTETVSCRGPGLSSESFTTTPSGT